MTSCMKLLLRLYMYATERRPSYDRQRNAILMAFRWRVYAILMAFRWRAYDGPSFNLGLVHCMFEQ